MEPVIKGCQEWGRRGAPGVNNGEDGCFLLSADQGSDPFPSLGASLGLGDWLPSWAQELEAVTEAV